MRNFEVRVLTEDGEIEIAVHFSDESRLDSVYEFYVATYIDTEMPYEYGDTVWTIQAIELDAGPFDTGTVLYETNSIVEHRG